MNTSKLSTPALDTSSDSLNAVDQIDQKLDQLTALLNVARCGDFALYDTMTQNNYLWICHELACEITVLMEAETPAVLAKLTALLSVARCEDFASYNAQTQNNYLWTCHEFACEIRRLMDAETAEVQA
ncbi:hypothetical protein SAMN02745130_02910 [Thiothrix eikelboomii]|uniref:Uncharacterized protein n=1 Tax=Thiothrix eikelboomii TaxID=92487 RepID=A0A1T4XF68_9GAMM|nr:hypothetical protein [Thiothrix eikelboomii]SKA88244.1 hypothetical protein SAMN02745130_02910 [Thiothrix eikelboomii]